MHKALMPHICCFISPLHTNPNTQQIHLLMHTHAGKHGRMGLLTASLSLSSSLQLPPTPEVQQVQSTAATSQAKANFFPDANSHSHSHPRPSSAVRSSHECQGSRDAPSRQDENQDSESRHSDDMDQTDGQTSHRADADLSIAVAAVMHENSREGALACLSLISRYFRKVVDSDDPK